MMVRKKVSMLNTGMIVGELAVSVTSSTAIATSINAEPLVTALITFGVSLVTLVGGELIKFLVTYFKKKTEELEKSKTKKEKQNENKK